MKALNSISAKTSLVVIVILLLAINNLSAQSVSVKYSKDNLSKNAIGNLIVGINSQNEGVKRCCIYFAGLYEINEATDALVDVLSKEKDPKNRVLIALALYKIGNPIGMDAVYKTASVDKDSTVRRKCAAIYNEFVSLQTKIIAAE